MNPTKCSEALAELEGLLEPHLWITDLNWQAGLIGVATVTGQAKPLGLTVDKFGRIAPGEYGPTEIRAAMFASAQEAIRVVEEAGYRHDRHPALTIDGRAQRENAVTILHTEATLTLTLKPPKREAS